jgi:zinc transporter 13
LLGGLLGDVFLHLFPEAYAAAREREDSSSRLNLGMWILGGILAFLIIEKIFQFTEDSKSDDKRKGSKRILGYLNLAANCIDNFLHGLTVASSFLTSIKLGIVTTLAILVHEIPHEVGDFAILIRSGFSRWEAGKAQLGTAGVGVLGAIVALSLDSVQSLEARTSWILPFSAGGFLNIALVSILPELMRERNPVEGLKQLACMLLGILVMALLSNI